MERRFDVRLEELLVDAVLDERIIWAKPLVPRQADATPTKTDQSLTPQSIG
jgi:hypothetical protein